VVSDDDDDESGGHQDRRLLRAIRQVKKKPRWVETKYDETDSELVDPRGVLDTQVEGTKCLPLIAQYIKDQQDYSSAAYMDDAKKAAPGGHA
jgi:hypothetical protein